MNYKGCVITLLYFPLSGEPLMKPQPPKQTPKEPPPASTSPPRQQQPLAVDTAIKDFSDMTIGVTPASPTHTEVSPTPANPFAPGDTRGSPPQPQPQPQATRGTSPNPFISADDSHLGGNLLGIKSTIPKAVSLVSWGVARSKVGRGALWQRLLKGMR